VRGTVLVTGAAGFIGSAVVRQLVSALRQRPVICGRTPVDAVVAGVRPGGSRARLRELAPRPEWSVAEIDLTSPDGLRSSLEEARPTAVVHCGCDGVFDLDLPPERARRTNVAPLELLFEGLARTPGSRFIHAGTAFVLAGGDGLSESAPLAPRTGYARSKAEADGKISELGSAFPVDWFNLRLFHTYGAYEAPQRLFPHLVTSLAQGREARLSAGEQVRDFNRVESMAGAFLAALEADAARAGGLYHIGSGRGQSVRAFATAVAEITGREDLLRFDARKLHPGEVASWVADPTRARQELGWTAPEDERTEVVKATHWWMDHLKVAP